MNTITLEVLNDILEHASVLSRHMVLVPPTPMAKVMPSLFPKDEGGKKITGTYILEQRYVDGQVVDCVILDSTQSQANRMELALLKAFRKGLIALPVVAVEIDGTRYSTLELPHRLADAILLDSQDPKTGKEFMQTEIGGALRTINAKNAAPLLRWAPHTLVFGIWMSRRGSSALDARFARLIQAEIIGVNPRIGKIGAVRRDPLNIRKIVSPIYRSEDGWTFDKTQAKPDEKGKIEELDPAEISHGNIISTIHDGGAAIDYAAQNITISIAGLRMLQFIEEGKDISKEAQRYLLSLALLSVTLLDAEGYFLRSGCMLVPRDSVPDWRVVTYRDGKREESTLPPLSTNEAIDLYHQALESLRQCGGRIETGEHVFQPQEKLLRLIRESR